MNQTNETLHFYSNKSFFKKKTVFQCFPCIIATKQPLNFTSLLYVECTPFNDDNSLIFSMNLEYSQVF